MSVLDIDLRFRIRIQPRFRDFNRRTHLDGAELTLASRAVLPYDGLARRYKHLPPTAFEGGL